MSAFSKLFLLVVVCGAGLVLWWQYYTPIVEPKTVPASATTTRSYFEPLIPWQIGSRVVFASLANTQETRTLGLSYTSELPPDIVKVFIFDTDERWSFWMKEMHYPIDIVWVTASGTVAHIESQVMPETYPESFTPGVPTRYVIETVPGLLDSAGVEVGEAIDMRVLIEKVI